MKLKEKARELKTKLSALFLAYKRGDTPLIAKIAAAIAVGYALSPIDLIPDFVPLLGYLDDIVILPLLIALAVKLIPKNIMEECLVQAKNLWQGRKPIRWRYAVPIIALWLFISMIVAYRIFFWAR